MRRAKLDALVERSLRSAALCDEVKARLSQSALGLSGGQQQRLCVARAGGRARELRFLTSDADKASFRSGTIDATNAFIDDPEMSRDSNSWYRQSADDILQHRDGITLDASRNGAATRFFGKSLGRPSDATANSYG